MQASTGVPKLLYFPLHGRACKIRLLLKHAGIEFVDEQPGQGDWKSWPELKTEFPDRGGVPWVDMGDGKVLNQSDAILKAFAQQAGYKSSDPWVNFETEWVFETMADFAKSDGAMTPFFKQAFGGTEAPTEEECKKSLDAITGLLNKLESRFSANGGRNYSAGDTISASDFSLLAFEVGMYGNPSSKCPEHCANVKAAVDKCPTVKGIIERVKGEKGLAAYITEMQEKYKSAI